MTELTETMNLDQRGARVKSRDRRLAAIHEAGHLVIARRFRIPVTSAYIFPTDNPAWDEKHWIGRIQGEFLLHTRGQRLMFGVAGAVAEMSWRNVEDLDWSEEWWDAETMSETDWKMAGCVPGNPDGPCFTAIKRVARHFDRRTGRLWPSLIKTARTLIIQSRPEWHARRVMELAA